MLPLMAPCAHSNRARRTHALLLHNFASLNVLPLAFSVALRPSFALINHSAKARSQVEAYKDSIVQIHQIVPMRNKVNSTSHTR